MPVPYVVANNKGDLGAVLKELGSSDTIKGVATAVVTAGIFEGLQAQGIIKDFNADLSWQKNLSNGLFKAGAKSVVNTALGGGSLNDNLENSLTNALIDWGAQTATKKIGDKGVAAKGSDNPVWSKGGWEKTLAHALVGCAAAAAKTEDCGSGASGAAIAEILSPWLEDNGLEDRTDQLVLELVNSVVAGVTNQDVATAVAAGYTTEAYNRQLHNEEVKYLEDKLAQKYVDDVKINNVIVSINNWILHRL